MMAHLQALWTIFTVMIIYLTYRSDARNFLDSAESCVEVPDVDPRNCKYGVVTDYCGNLICAQGPNMICGEGDDDILGKCGAGLTCICGRCVGCGYSKIDCYFLSRMSCKNRYRPA